MEVNAVFLHSEFGINAGLHLFSWRLTQKTKAGTMISDITSRVILGASLRLEALAVTALIDSTGQHT